jgi:hypothetical protein
MRSFFGIAIPFGNSDNIRFHEVISLEDQWQSLAATYSLGPGSSRAINDFNEANMKIALSAEFRLGY